jgi:hypothetical protein
MTAPASRTRDFLGYGGRPPAVRWPDDARVAVSLVVNIEEGAELAVTYNGRGFVFGEDFARYCIAAFDRLWDEGEAAPRMMTIGLHLRIIGRPGRIGGLTSFLDHLRQGRRLARPPRPDRTPLARCGWSAAMAPLHAGVPGQRTSVNPIQIPSPLEGP